MVGRSAPDATDETFNSENAAGASVGRLAASDGIEHRARPRWLGRDKQERISNDSLMYPRSGSRSVLALRLVSRERPDADWYWDRIMRKRQVSAG